MDTKARDTPPTETVDESLAEAIGNAAIELGVINREASLTAPMVLPVFNAIMSLAKAGLERLREQDAKLADSTHDTVTLEMTVDHAQAVKGAADIFMRLALGQIEEIADLLRMGHIPVNADHRETRQVADPERLDRFEAVMREAKTILRFAPNASFGIGHPHVADAGKRAYEVYRVLSQALAKHRNPSPTFKGIDYDGLTVRYTQDPPPRASVTSASPPP